MVLDVIATFIVNVDHGRWAGAPGIPIIRWLDEFNKNSIRFEKDASGSIAAMVIDAVSRFRR